MVAYSFHPRFVPAIQAGVKRGTIRRQRIGVHGHAQPGDVMQFYTAGRKRLIGRARCVQTEAVVLGLSDAIVYFPWSTEALTSDADLAAFARRDGFSSWRDLVAFWRVTHPGMGEFQGVLILWGDTFHPATVAGGG